MATATKTRWQMTGHGYEFCNCDFGCDCNFGGVPPIFRRPRIRSSTPRAAL